MIPAYPTDLEPTVTLNGVDYPLTQVSLIMWDSDIDDSDIASSEDSDKSYDDYLAATSWVIVLQDDTQITVNPDELDSGTRELISQVAFPS